MEICARMKPALGLVKELVIQVSNKRSTDAPLAAIEPPAAVEARMAPLREALRALPEVDMEKVQAVKNALARGELHDDPPGLARAMLSWAPGGTE